MRLYGGAQYHRAMAEFRLIVGKLKCQTISREEIVNACGVEDIHDGTNYVRYCLFSLFFVVFFVIALHHNDLMNIRVENLEYSAGC